jgi:small neutral amino acid transporter SnatA (MarC family)
MQQQMTLVSACITLFLVLDAPGNVPFFLSILKDVPPRRRRWVMIRELLIALGVLVAFLLGGRELLSVMQLRQEAISIGGGVVLFLIAIKMVFPPRDGGIFGPVGQGEPFIVPLAIPGVAGPSAMATLLLMTSAQPGRQVEWGLALLIAWLATAAILLGSTWLFKLLGESVLASM